MKNRILEDSINNAERLRDELPKLIFPESFVYDMINLVDEIYRLNKLIKDDCKCPTKEKENWDCHGF